ncbi:uncharacterized protein BDW47DRAFT_101424 [Aspergillus candidus]|uniref:Uncharacterized protein n=1 Tax=Aspergillus candidus TaxID=41067 RepID=A0A2I2FJ22_ASPCN|nr:hypothetical protein BDW47DRAFT_101424 [Aspergillus candidus]PLB40614.1 hypothetical protein BDW47DRAFT_101424 [Aspergillus candidus]
MKLSNILLCLAPTIALAADQIPPAPTPAIPHSTPSTSLLNNLDPSNSDAKEPLEPQQVLHLANDNAPLALVEEDPATTTVPDPWPAPAKGHIGLGTLTPSPGATKSLRARSEGTLGQTPWIGMAIGLTCTALAAVMLG